MDGLESVCQASKSYLIAFLFVDLVQAFCYSVDDVLFEQVVVLVLFQTVEQDLEDGC